MKNAFNLGDIVSMRIIGDEHYYMITDHVDFTSGDGKIVDIDYEVVLLYPTTREPVPENIMHDELEVVAKFNSEEYKEIMEFVAINRTRNGCREFPNEIEHIAYDLDEVLSVYEKNPFKVVKEFGAKEIKEILEDTKGQEQVDLYVDRMNIHLGLLHEAINKGDTEQIEFNKTKLEEVRQTLIELEYFPLAKRRAGVHTRIK